MNWREFRDAMVSWLSEPQTGLAVTALVLIALSGCSIFDGPRPLHSNVTVDITLADHVSGGYAGRAFWFDNQCQVLLLRDSYPRCLQHEIRHCFEGAFHGAQPSDEDCYVE